MRRLIKFRQQAFEPGTMRRRKAGLVLERARQRWKRPNGPNQSNTILPRGNYGARRCLARFVLLASALLILIIATGCRYTAAPADLLQKPAIATDKQRLSHAIERALPKYGKLTLPLKDDYYEAIRLIDVDGDGVDEAVVTFYNEYSTPEILILKNTDNGWRQWLLVEQPLARGIAWLKLDDLDGDGHTEMFVGWIGAFDSPNMLELYSFQSKAVRNAKGRLTLKPVESLPYSLAETGELDGDDVKELVVVSGSNALGEMEWPAYSLSVYSWNENRLNKRMELRLPDTVNSYDRLLLGEVAPGRPGIVLEGNTGAHSMLTYMYVWEGRGLRLVYPDAKEEQEGFSGRPVASGDMNGDGIIELHWTTEAPGYPDVPYSDSVWMNAWVQWDGGAEFKLVSEQFIDYAHGIKLDIPEQWNGRYTMRKPEGDPYSVVAFYYWDKLSEETAKLATLYAVPQRHWSSVEAKWKEERASYHLLSVDSGNVYSAVFERQTPEGLGDGQRRDMEEMLQVEERFESLFKIEHDK